MQLSMTWGYEMILPLLLALLSLGGTEDPPALRGRIQGVVVNGSRGDKPIANADVLLRGGPDGALEPLARTRTDLYGKFSFEHVPLDSTIVYLPGADRDGVHYPGERVRVDAANRFPYVRIVAFDGVESPSPLAVRRHEIDIVVQPELMQISETLVVANRSRATYIGKQVEDGPGVTLPLSVPPNFDRITFGSEFYGRRFRIVDHQPRTDIPWPPGERELAFSYRIPKSTTGGEFLRSLDMPSRNITVRVRGAKTENVSCSLPPAETVGGAIVFTSGDKELAAGRAIEVQIGSPPVPWAEYTRWGSLAALAALSITTAVVLRRRSEVSGAAARSG
jgi:hypothetical protein